jgi:methionine aminopeptidase, type I
MTTVSAPADIQNPAYRLAALFFYLSEPGFTRSGHHFFSMSIETSNDLTGMQAISDVVGIVLKQMQEYAKPGMSTRALDNYGGELLRQYGARPAPKLMYGFPGHTCVSVNQEVAHGIPSANVILQEGDLVNVDVSAERNGYFSDNGGSFVLGNDIHQHNKLVNASKRILRAAIARIRAGMRIAEIGRYIETEARKAGFTVIKNLVGHGVGRSLHEAPFEIPCWYDRTNTARFKKNAVVAIETFISTRATAVVEKGDGWTYITRDGSFVAQHEHTIVVTDEQPVILTTANGI